MKLRKLPKPTNTQIIILAFLVLVMLGAFLLALPVASKSGNWTPMLDAVFTAASAVCVTGLVVVDTYSHWSLFGQIVIMMLIQIGGIGFMSIITLFSMFLGRKIGLAERQLIMQASGMLYMGGVVRLLKKIVLGTLLFQGIGAVLLSFRFVPEMGWGAGLFNAWFHAVSAFCNAGFDLMGRHSAFSSLSTFAADPLILLTIAALYIIGGLGFLVWNDVNQHKYRVKKYSLHTKIVLTVSAALLVLATLGFFFIEAGHSMAGMDTPTRWVNSLFQASTPRTAGFSVLDMGDLSEPGLFMTTGLMVVGGSPGSTAGGLKTTTLLVLILSAMMLPRKNKHIALFRRRLTDDTVTNANALFVFYTAIILTATFIIIAIEPFGLLEVIFEVISALGTVGLSFGITSQLGVHSQAVITLLMFAGRVGFMTLVMALLGRRRENAQERVPEKILIG